VAAARHPAVKLENGALSSVPALYKNVIHPRNTGNQQDTRMSRILRPLLYMLASATKQELARQVSNLRVVTMLFY
jgi:hypothetical protein